MIIMSSLPILTVKHVFLFDRSNELRNRDYGIHGTKFDAHFQSG